MRDVLYYGPMARFIVGDGRVREFNLRNSYKLSGAEYAKLHKQQGGRCAICHRLPHECGNKALSVDHSHTTEKVRGLLCSSCNTGLGMFADDVTRLKDAIVYLEEYKVKL